MNPCHKCGNEPKDHGYVGRHYACSNEECFYSKPGQLFYYPEEEWNAQNPVCEWTHFTEKDLSEGYDTGCVNIFVGNYVASFKWCPYCMGRIIFK